MPRLAIFTALISSALFPLLFTAGLASADPAAVPISPDEKTISCQPGVLLDISGDFASSSSLDHSMLLIDGQLAATRPSDFTSKDHYDYQWTAGSPGMHSVNIHYALSDGSFLRVRHLTIDVLPDDPLYIFGVPKTAVGDVTVKVSTVPGMSISAASLECFLDGQSIGTATGQDVSFVVPLHQSLPGPHTLLIAGTDTSGRRFVEAPQAVTVPDRLTLNIPATLTLQHFGDGAPMSVSLADGVKIASVSYAWGKVLPAPPAGGTLAVNYPGRGGRFGQTGTASPAHPPAPVMQTVGSASAAPYSAVVNADQMATADYQVQATATTDDGTIYTSPPVQMHFTNQAEADKEAEQAREAAVQEAAAEAAAAKAQALADAAAQRQRDIVYNAVPDVPNSPLSEPTVLAIKKYLLNDASEPGLHLHKIQDIKKSDSLVYPESVNAILIDPDLNEYRWVLQVNPDTGQVSDYVSDW